MARTHADVEPHVKAEASPSTSVHGIPAAAAPGSRSARVPKAYELTDPRGHRAYLWRDQGKWIVEADDPAFRRRILRSLTKPISSIEYEVDEFGERWCTREKIQPDDRRYPNRVFWSWAQIGLDDVKARVVRRHDRQVVWPAWDATD